MSVIDELNKLVKFDRKMSKRIEKLFKHNFTHSEYVEIKKNIRYSAESYNPKYNYEDFKRQREMISCILYSTIGQESKDWINEWSDIPYKVFTGAEPDSYEYDQIKLFVENYYNLMKETGNLKMFVNEEYYLNKWKEENKDNLWKFEQDLRVYEGFIEIIKENIRKLKQD